MKALVTGAGALLGQGIIRALRLSSLKAELVAVDPNRDAVGLFWADRSHVILPVADPGYLDRFREVLAAERPDVVLVGTDVELPVLASHRHELEKEFHCHVVVSDSRVVEIANDKWLTYLFLKEAGLPHPRSSLPQDVNTLVEQTGFPLIVKPRVGARSVGVELVKNRSELAAALDRQPGLVVQENVGDSKSEFTAGVVYFDGEAPISIVMRRDLRDGNTYRAFVDADAALNDYVRRVAVALRPYGPVNFQFRTDGGVPKIFEINGRYSGTTPMRARAGFNEVEIVIRRLLDRVPLRQPAVANVSFLRYWDELMIPSAPAPGQ